MNSIIKKLLKIAQTPRESIGEIGFSNISITSESALRVSVNHVLETAYSDISLDDSASFFPPREKFDEYQAVIFSSNGTRVESKISRFYNEDFILAFKGFEPVPEKSDRDQYKKIFRTESMEKTDTLKTQINGGWFWDEKSGGEYSLLLIVKKPENIFKRFTIIIEPDAEGNPVPRPSVVMDNYTRTQFDYPMIFAREFHAAVYSEYITLRLDKYIINKATAEIPEVSGATSKDFKLKKRPIPTSEIDLKNIGSIYERQLPFLEELRHGATDLVSRKNSGAIEQVLDRAYRDTSGGTPEIDDKKTLQKIKDLENEKKEAETMGIDTSDVDKQIAALKRSLDVTATSSDEDFNKVVYLFGEKLGTTPSEKMAKDLGPAVETLTKGLGKDYKDKLKGEARINAPAFISKDVSVPYVTPVPKMYEKEAAGVNFDIGIPGQFTIVDTPQGPVLVRHHTEGKTSSVDVTFPNFQKVKRGFDFYQQIKDFFRHVLGAKDSQKGLSEYTKPQSKYYEERSQSDSLIKSYGKDVEELEKRLSELKETANEYHVPIIAGEPKQFNPDGTVKHPLAYIRDLEHYIYELQKYIPKTLDELESILSDDKKFNKLKKKDVSLLRIILDK